ncbi:MAG: hypothetical protein U1F18_11955 [Steroidobacteraceae bacterium]
MLARLHASTGLLLALPLLALASSGMVLLFKDPLLLPAEWRQAGLSQAAADAELGRLLGLPALRNVESVAPAMAPAAASTTSRRATVRRAGGRSAPARRCPRHRCRGGCGSSRCSSASTRSCCSASRATC